ncbi:Pentatricopeptide repeat-containing protein [Acorus calamus]|uniref:Pentatricopeptide repeat-containing protein n=1 Tax=Acorus calamus TaxID=4465 RepID=A0AAV9D1X6_ACOCL|nr:Pentatricopeptide repeat-containing protein [Acorus calamus]
MKSIQIISANHHRRSLLRLLRRSYSASAAAEASSTAAAAAAAAAPSHDEYARRNYANNVSEYNTVFGSLISQRRHYLLRDAYDDMVLDGVQPTRDTFHSLIVGAMKGSRMQDAFFFRDEMKTLGLVPDVSLYNLLISACGKCKNSDSAILLLEEMKRYQVKPNGQTYICLLNACAATGHVDRVYTIVRDMTAAGLGLNKFCYAGLIAAQKNKKPATEDIATKIIELVKQSKGWSSVEASKDAAENVMMGISEEELYNIPTADIINRRGFLNRQLTVYHAAFNACADLGSKETLETLLEMLKQDGKSIDAFIVMQMMRCYFRSGDFDRGHTTFTDYFSSGKPPITELYVTLVEGAMVGYTPRGMEIAENTLNQMVSMKLLPTVNAGSELLIVASREPEGSYTCANFIWDMLRNRGVTPSFPAVDAYLKGLKRRQIPADDPRLMLVDQMHYNLQMRFGGGRIF